MLNIIDCIEHNYVMMTIYKMRMGPLECLMF